MRPPYNLDAFDLASISGSRTSGAERTEQAR